MGHENIVSILIAAGADVNLPDTAGCSPSFIACQQGSDKILSLLVAAGADANKADNEGHRSYCCVCLFGHD